MVLTSTSTVTFLAIAYLWSKTTSPRQIVLKTYLRMVKGFFHFVNRPKWYTVFHWILSVQNIEVYIDSPQSSQALQPMFFVMLHKHRSNFIDKFRPILNSCVIRGEFSITSQLWSVKYFYQYFKLNTAVMLSPSNKGRHKICIKKSSG